MAEVVAERRLDEIVEELNRAYAAESDCAPGLVVDYLLVYAVRRFDDAGNPLTAYGINWPADNRTSHYAALGLLEYARAKIMRSLLPADTFGDDS